MARNDDIEAIRRYLIDRFGDEAAGLREDTPLLGEILDSIGVLSLATHIEDTWGITVGAHEMDPSNFGTLGGIADFIFRKAASKE